MPYCANTKRRARRPPLLGGDRRALSSMPLVVGLAPGGACPRLTMTRQCKRYLRNGRGQESSPHPRRGLTLAARARHELIDRRCHGVYLVAGSGGSSSRDPHPDHRCAPALWSSKALSSAYPFHHATSPGPRTHPSPCHALQVARGRLYRDMIAPAIVHHHRLDAPSLTGGWRSLPGSRPPLLMG